MKYIYIYSAPVLFYHLFRLIVGAERSCANINKWNLHEISALHLLKGLRTCLKIHTKPGSGARQRIRKAEKKIAACSNTCHVISALLRTVRYSAPHYSLVLLRCLAPHPCRGSLIILLVARIIHQQLALYSLPK